MDKKKILVYGDVIIDRYIYGRLIDNPTEHGKIFKISKEEDRLGGAGAVAYLLDNNNTNVCLYGITARYANICDPRMGIAESLLSHTTIFNYCAVDEDKYDTIKTRCINIDTNTLCDIRYDIDNLFIPDDHAIDQMINRWTLAVSLDSDIILISDYNKGAVIQQVLNKLNPHIPMIVDPGYSVPWSKYPKHAIIKANLREARKEAGNEKAEPFALLSLLNTHDTIIITAGEDGIYYKQNDICQHIPGLKVPVVDTCGAGDVVLASLGLSLLENKSLHDACIEANQKAAEHVQTIGHQTVSQTKVYS